MSSFVVDLFLDTKDTRVLDSAVTSVDYVSEYKRKLYALEWEIREAGLICIRFRWGFAQLGRISESQRTLYRIPSDEIDAEKNEIIGKKAQMEQGSVVCWLCLCEVVLVGEAFFYR